MSLTLEQQCAVIAVFAFICILFLLGGVIAVALFSRAGEADQLSERIHKAERDERLK